MTESVKTQKNIEAVSMGASPSMAGLMSSVRGKWAGRWVWAAVIQGAIITAITVLIIQPLSYFNITPYFNPAMVIAGGGGGTWLFTGYIIYLVVGVVGVAVTAVFYFYIEGITGRVYQGLSNYIAWGHFILMNVGVAASMILMIYGGYLAGWAGAAVSSGGLGYSNYQIHVNYLSHFEDPIGGLAIMAALGILLGGVGFVLRTRSK
ncbi:MAG: hypothetical protein OK441_02340 [Thaumarchaeota archaeon]|nr:hypothetical protein [Nitrososphaerota archaeon]